MRELFEENGYDPDELTHPRDVTADDIDEESRVIVYAVVPSHDPDGLSTTYDVVERDIDDVVPTDEVEAFTDGAVSYPDETPVTHGVVHGYRSVDNLPVFASIGYGDEMYAGDDFADPNRWDRLVTNVRGKSDDFVRFDL